MIVGANKPIICRAGQQAGNADTISVFYSLGFFLFWKPQLLLVRPSAGQVKHTHMVEGNLFYFKSCDYKWKPLLQNTFIFGLVFGQTPGDCSPRKWVYQIDHSMPLRMGVVQTAWKRISRAI